MQVDEVAEVYRKSVELYCSKEFLLNITAEAIGVLAEIILVSLIIKWFIDRRDLRSWRIAFKRRIRKVLEHHHKLPEIIADPRYDLELRVSTFWGHPVEEYLQDALDLVPPTLANPDYQAAEDYLEELQRLNLDFHLHEKVEHKVLEALNGNAAKLAEYMGLADNATYVWSADQLRDILRSLKVEVMRLSSSRLPKTKKPT